MLSNLEGKSRQALSPARRAFSMANILEGKPDAQGLKIGIVVSRFNNFVTEQACSKALWMDLRAMAARRTM